MRNLSILLGLFAALCYPSWASERICWSGVQVAEPGQDMIFILAMGANTEGVSMANQDAEAFSNALRSHFEVPAANVCVLTDVRNWEFRDTLTKLAELVRPQDTVFIYFSGHGTYVQDKTEDEIDCMDEAFVTFYPQGRQEPDLVRDDTFIRLTNKLNTDKLFAFLDTCYASSFRRNLQRAECPDKGKTKILRKGNAGKRPRGRKCRQHKSLRTFKGTLYSAASAHQAAWEIKQKGGRFTRIFLNNLVKYRNTSRDRYDALDAVFQDTKNTLSSRTRNTVCEQTPERWGK